MYRRPATLLAVSRSALAFGLIANDVSARFHRATVEAQRAAKQKEPDPNPEPSLGGPLHPSKELRPCSGIKAAMRFHAQGGHQSPSDSELMRHAAFRRIWDCIRESGASREDAMVAARAAWVK